MVKRRRNKKVALPASWRPSKSRRKAREVTTIFHRLRAETSDLDDASLSGVNTQDTTPEIKDIMQKFNSIGGLRAYQAASVVSTAANRSSSKYVFRTLTKLKLRPTKGQAPVKVNEIKCKEKSGMRVKRVKRNYVLCLKYLRGRGWDW